MKNIIIAITAVGLVLIGLFIFNRNNNQPKEELIDNKVNKEINMEENNFKTIATFETNKGNFKIGLYTDKTPKTTENFIKLAKEEFYNGTKFHRIIVDFMIQGGDPQSKDDSLASLWGTGGPGYKFEDEFVPELSNVVGTISMANSGPNTNGSQFFINVADNTFLDGKHTVFGKVVEGLDLVMDLSKVETGDRDIPVEAVVINKITIN